MSKKLRDPIEIAGAKFVDISSNKWREYVYPGGAYRIEGPDWLHVKPQTESLHSHRIIDKAGTSHYLPSGFLAVRWQSDENFVMIDPKEMTTGAK